MAKKSPSAEDLARGQRIKDARIRRGISQSELAKRIRRESQTVSLYERGVNAPSGTVLLRLAEELNVTPQWIEHGAQREAVDERPDTRGWLDFVARGYVDFFLARGATQEQIEHARRTPFKGTPRSSDYVRLLEDVLATDAAHPEPEELTAARRRAQGRPDLSGMLPAVGEKDR